MNIFQYIICKDMKTERELEKVGDRNAFQIYVIIFVCLKWLVISLTVFLPSYLFVAPTFTCGNQMKVNEANACSRLDSCKIDLNQTITAHMQLYCDKQYIRDSVISAEFIGSVAGLIILSILADKLGRKIIIVSTLFLTAIGSMVLSLGGIYKVLPLLYIGQILIGFGGYSLSMVSYSYLSEINNDSWRQKSLIATYSFWAIGQIMLYPIITWIQDWLLICFFIFIVPLLFLLGMSYFIVETPEFLYVTGEYERCLESLNGIAKFNRKPPITALSKPKPNQGDEEPQKISTAFFKKQYIIPLVVLSFAQVCNNGLYYTTQYSINDLGHSFQVNMLVIGCLQLATCLITNFYCEKMYRKRWIIIFMCSAGILGVLMQVMSPGSVIQIIFVGLSRVGNTFSFALFSLITTESFPTEIRSTGTGVSEAMSNLGNMGAPFLRSGAAKIGVKGVFIGGFVCIAGGASMLLVKQTKKEKTDQQQPLLGDQQIIPQTTRGTLLTQNAQDSSSSSSSGSSSSSSSQSSSSSSEKKSKKSDK